jgi:hypothetical protein
MNVFLGPATCGWPESDKVRGIPLDKGPDGVPPLMHRAGEHALGKANRGDDGCAA